LELARRGKSLTKGSAAREQEIIDLTAENEELREQQSNHMNAIN
jgi:hypothetical protein